MNSLICSLQFRWERGARDGEKYLDTQTFKDSNDFKQLCTQIKQSITQRKRGRVV